MAKRGYIELPTQSDEEKKDANQSIAETEEKYNEPEYSVGVSFAEQDKKIPLATAVVREDRFANRTPRTPVSRKRMSKRKGWKAPEDVRPSEGEIFDISPELGKKKGKRKGKKAKPVALGKDYSQSPAPEFRKGEEFKREEQEYPTDEEITCLVARSAMILPCAYKLNGNSQTAYQWTQKLTGRRLHTSEGVFPVWEPATSLPRELGDLSPLFQQVFGWKVQHAQEKIWSCHRLVMNEVVMKELFSDPSLCVIQNGEVNPYEFEINSIEILLYPLGTAILVLYLNWLPKNRGPKEKELSLHDIRTLIFVSKYRHKISEVCDGWGLTPTNADLKAEILPQLRHDLGEELFAARYRGETVSLSTLGNWLLHLENEDTNAVPERLDHARHAYHHSTVVLDREPPSDILQAYLFHLRHAYGQKNRPPMNSTLTLGKVLVWRQNRYIGISKEGTVSISWPITGGPDDFEVRQWHQKFLGVYLLLALHVHAEKWVLFGLSDMAASQAERLKLDSEVNSLGEIKRSRDRMRDLASLMVRYTLGMSSNECGGTSEYSDFFSSLRVVFGVPELRDELSNELKDVSAVVESNYLEEERRQRDEQEANRRRNYELQKSVSQARSQQNDAFQILLSIIGSFTLPFVLISGVWGMNVSNLPDVDFYTLTGITLASSIFVLLLLLILRWYLRLNIEKSKKQVMRLNYISREPSDSFSLPTSAMHYGHHTELHL